MANCIIDRRNFLKVSGTLVVAFSLEGIFEAMPARAAAVTKPVSLTEVD
jgi:hypothetical protein